MTDILKPPKTLSKDEKILFSRLAEDAKHRWKPYHLESLCEYVSVCVTTRELAKIVHRKDFQFSIETNGGKTIQTNPEFQAYMSSLKLLFKLAEQLGMTPVSEKKAKLTTPEDEENKNDKFANVKAVAAAKRERIM